jgi:hypothetical protein
VLNNNKSQYWRNNMKYIKYLTLLILVTATQAFAICDAERQRYAYTYSKSYGGNIEANLKNNIDDAVRNYSQKDAISWAERELNRHASIKSEGVFVSNKEAAIEHLKCFINWARNNSTAFGNNNSNQTQQSTPLPSNADKQAQQEAQDRLVTGPRESCELIYKRPDFNKDYLNILNNEYMPCLARNSSRERNAKRDGTYQAYKDTRQQTQTNSPLQLNPEQKAQEDAQQRAKMIEQEADQKRRGKRKVHDPAAEAHHCLAVNQNDPGFGSFVNKCNFKIDYAFCNYNPNKNSWADFHNCEGRSGNAGSIRANGMDAAHVNNTETVYFFACKSPAWPLDTEYVAGKGLSGRCYNVGGSK